MREKWLTLILRLTNLIYQKKQSEIVRQGWASVLNVFSLILLEMALAVISLPLYLTTSSAKASVYFEKKGGYKDVAVDYKLRRVLTLTGVGIIALLWLIKLLIILLTPKIYGPLQLYSVSDVEPLSIERREALIEGTQIQTARVLEMEPVPSIKRAEKKGAQQYVFSGSGKPGSTIILFLSDQNVMYSEQIDTNGNWQIEHSQKDVELSDGVHGMFAFNYSKESQVRSKSSPEKYFRIKTSLTDKLIRGVDVLANWSVVIIIIIGILLTALTI